MVIDLARPENCACGYEPGSAECECIVCHGRVVLKNHMDRDYACVVPKLLINLENKNRHAALGRRIWAVMERDDLLMCASEIVFLRPKFMSVICNVVVLYANNPTLSLIEQKAMRRLTNMERDYRGFFGQTTGPGFAKLQPYLLDS